MTDENAVPLSTVPTPLRSPGSRPLTSGFTWLPPEQVEGAILPAETRRRLVEYADDCRRRHGAALVKGASYVIS